MKSPKSTQRCSAEYGGACALASVALWPVGRRHPDDSPAVPSGASRCLGETADRPIIHSQSTPRSDRIAIVVGAAVLSN